MQSRKLIGLGALVLVLGVALIGSLGSAPAAAKDDPGLPDEESLRRVVIEDDDDRDAGESGYLGVQVQDLTRALRRAKNLTGEDGALVNEVSEGSPAEKAGIKQGDVIIEVNRNATDDARDLTRTIRDLEPGTKVSIVVVRDGARKTLSAVIGPRPKGMGQDDSRYFVWRGRGDGEGPDWTELRDRLPMVPPEIMQRHHREISKELEAIQEELEQLRAEVRALRRSLGDRALLREDDRDREND